MPETTPPTSFSEWLKALPWWASTIAGILLGALQLLYPLWISHTPITGDTIIGALITVALGLIMPGAKLLNPPAK